MKTFQVMLLKARIQMAGAFFCLENKDATSLYTREECLPHTRQRWSFPLLLDSAAKKEKNEIYEIMRWMFASRESQQPAHI